MIATTRKFVEVGRKVRLKFEGNAHYSEVMQAYETEAGMRADVGLEIANRIREVLGYEIEVEFRIPRAQKHEKTTVQIPRIVISA